jgi:hypothetical protein
VLTLVFAVGRSPMGLKLGIVNKEQNCSNLSENLSFKFLDEIKEEKLFYDSFDAAFNDVKNGKLIGFLNIPANFTEVFLESALNIDERNLYTTSAVDVHLDKSNHQLTWFITQALYDSYFRFDKKFLNKTHEDYPIRVKTLYGKFTYDFRQSIFSSFISG